jgi:monoamine oxidase
MGATSLSDICDVAIVGGGVSGIYTGYRLLSGDLSPSPQLSAWAAKAGGLKVSVFEGSERIGGRLLSARPPGMPHVSCEMGGMRYVSAQPLVSALVENELKLARHQQVVDQPGNIAMLRGQRLRASQLQDPGVLPYSLYPDEQAWLRQGHTASTLMGWGIAKLLPQTQVLEGDALRRYLQTATIDGTPLYQHGFWNLLARCLSFEAYGLARAAVGYDCLGANANAVDLILEYFDFTPGVRYYLLDDGYEAVPWSLESGFVERGGELVCGRWLDGFEAATLADGSRGARLHFHDGRHVDARALVLAMPKRSLERLRRDGPVLGPGPSAQRVEWLMDSVEGFPFDKLFMVYERPWWEVAGVSQGRSLTDAPIRQCYYWAVEGRQPGADPADTNAAVMAYNDVSNAEFWGGLRGIALGPHDTKELDLGAWHRRRRAARRTNAFRRSATPVAASATPGDDFTRRQRLNWDTHEAPQAMVAEMHRQLMLLHGLDQAPEPVDAAYVDWTDDPFGGGVHLWNPGYKSWEVCDEMTQPVADFPCYVCGEAYSVRQTWVEGALETAEHVLQQRLGLGAPAWLKP